MKPMLYLPAALLALSALAACDSQPSAGSRVDWADLRSQSPAQRQAQDNEADDFGACRADDLPNFSCD